MSMKKNRNTKKIAFKVVQIKSLAMHITNQKLTKYLHGTWCLLNILMNVGIKEKMIILTHTMYWHKYSRATYDWFCGPGSHIKRRKKLINSKITKIYKFNMKPVWLWLYLWWKHRHQPDHWASAAESDLSHTLHRSPTNTHKWNT